MEKFLAEHVPGRFYSCANVKRGGDMDVFSGSLTDSQGVQAIQDGVFQPDGASEDLQACDSRMAVPSAQQHTDVLFFTVLAARHGQRKSSKVDKRMHWGVGTMAVCQHYITEINHSSKRVQVLLESVPVGSGGSWSRLISAGAWLQDVVVWNKSGQVDFTFSQEALGEVPDCTSCEHLAAVAQELADAGAFPGTSCFFEPAGWTDQKKAAMMLLSERGLLHARPDGAMQLSEQGSAVLQARMWLGGPQWLASAETEKPIRQRSTAALLKLLEDSGWTLQRLPHDVRVVAPFGPLVQPSGQPLPDKVFYLRADRKTVDREYLVALALTADEEHSQALLGLGVSHIHHLLSAGHYAAMNARDSSKMQLLALEADNAEVHALPRAGGSRAGGSRAGGLRRVVQFKVPESFRWGCVSFKGIRRTGRNGAMATVGFQCDCPRFSHLRHTESGSKTVCTFSMNFETPEQQDLVLRRLKWWVLQAWSCSSQRAHALLRKRVPSDEELPSQQQLDEQMPDQDRPLTDDEAAAVQPAKRSRPAQAASSSACSSQGVPASPDRQVAAASSSGSGSSSDSASGSSSTAESGCEIACASDSD